MKNYKPINNPIRPPQNNQDRVYICRVDGCDVLRSIDEGGAIFTVCDEHWGKRKSSEYQPKEAQK